MQPELNFLIFKMTEGEKACTDSEVVLPAHSWIFSNDIIGTRPKIMQSKRNRLL